MTHKQEGMEWAEFNDWWRNRRWENPTDTDDGNYFTVVFEGSLDAIPGIPLEIQSPFGRAISAAAGDLISRCDEFEIVAESLTEPARDKD